MNNCVTIFLETYFMKEKSSRYFHKLARKLNEDHSFQIPEEGKDFFDKNLEANNESLKVLKEIVKDCPDRWDNKTFTQYSMYLKYRNIVSVIILEYLYDKQIRSLNEVQKHVWSIMPKCFNWNTTAKELCEVIIYLLNTEYLILVRDNEVEDQKTDDTLAVTISKLGIQAVNNQLFESIAADCFYSSHNAKITTMSLLIAIGAFVISIVTSLVSIFR